MIDLAKQLGNDPEMIRLAQLFVQQPRNAVSNLTSALNFTIFLLEHILIDFI